MKKFISLSKLCVFVVILMTSLFPALAADFMVDSICYNIIGDNAVEVTSRGTDKYRGVIAIPATVVQDGITYQVTRIGDNAFSSCSELTLIDLPEGITSIGTNAFYYCRGLEAVEFPASLVSIGQLAFYDCKQITTLNITRNVTDIMWGAFNNCTGLKSITCSPFNPAFRAVDGILYNKDMTTLMLYPKAAQATSFSVPESVTGLGAYSFQNCDNLQEINIHDGVTWLGRDVFWQCDGIESMILPDGITQMGKGTFSSCTKLAYVHLPAAVDSLDDTFSLCPVLREIVIPRNVKYIGKFTFYEATGLESITFEEGSSLMTIDEVAFANCRSLKSFDMPNSVTTVNYDAFQDCVSLKSIHLSDNLTNLANAVFWECSSLTEIKIPNSVVSIRNGLLFSCSSLKTLKIGDKYGIPGHTTFERSSVYAESLERIELGANISSLVESTFSLLPNLKVFICWGIVPPDCDGGGSVGFNVPYNSVVLYVPKASLEAYSTATEWKKFKTIVPIEDVGDVNGDGLINISDVTALVDLLLGGETDRTAFCDVNLDGSVNISDVTVLVDLLLSGSN